MSKPTYSNRNSFRGNFLVNNLFVKFDCNCWASRGCIHGSSGLIVVIKDCGLAYPVYSLVDGTTNSKAMKVYYIISSLVLP